MSSSSVRTVVSQGMIGIGLVAGLHVLWVGPTEHAAAQALARSEARAAEIRDAESARDSVAALDRELTSLHTEADRIDRAGKLVRDPSGLFAAVGTIAASCAVRIDQMEPISERSSGRARGGPSELSFAYRITARAEYHDLIRFLGEVSRDLGFTRIRAANFSSAADGGASVIVATIETEHFAFEMPRPGEAAPGGGR